MSKSLDEFFPPKLCKYCKAEVRMGSCICQELDYMAGVCASCEMKSRQPEASNG